MIDDLALDPEYIIEMLCITFLAKKSLNNGFSHRPKDATSNGNAHVGPRSYLKSAEMTIIGSHD